MRQRELPPRRGALPRQVAVEEGGPWKERVAQIQGWKERSEGTIAAGEESQ